MRDFWKVMLAWFLGLVSAFLLQWASTSSDQQAIARLLYLEVNDNLGMLKLQEAVALKIDQLGRFVDEHGKPTSIKAARFRPVGGSYLRTTLFETTLSKQGHLTPSVLQALHLFYWNVQQADRFQNASEEPSRSDNDRTFFLASKAQLLRNLEKEATCGMACRGWGWVRRLTPAAEPDGGSGSTR